MDETTFLKRLTHLEEIWRKQGAQLSALQEFTTFMAAELAKQGLLGQVISRYIVLRSQVANSGLVDTELSAAETDLQMQLMEEKMTEVITAFSSKLPPGQTIGNSPKGPS